MWRIYLNSDDGLAIRSSVRRLRAALGGAGETLHLGKVRYLDHTRDTAPDGHELEAFFCKRKSFRYPASSWP